MDLNTRIKLQSIQQEMQDYVDQEVDPGFDLIEEWANRIKEAVTGAVYQ